MRFSFGLFLVIMSALFLGNIIFGIPGIIGMAVILALILH